MLRNDGDYVLYVIQTRSDGYRNGEWFLASFDHFGTPPGFSASGACWQKTGIEGVLSIHDGLRGLEWIAQRHPGREFRLAQVLLSQTLIPVSTLCVPEPPK